MPFADVRGQAPALELIGRALQAQRQPSAWLFRGPIGVGKGLCALRVAQALNCPHASPVDSCGHCDVCRQIEAGNFADVAWLEPSGQNIRMEQIQEALRWMQYRPERGHYRVLILDSAERFNRESANAFLKTLEEPPPQTTIILLTLSPALLPETILSRCQQVRFRPLSAPLVENLLAEQTELSASDRAWLARLGQGSLRLEMAEQIEELQKLQELWQRWLIRLGPNEMAELLPKLQEWSSAKESTWGQLLDWLETWFRDLAWLLHELPEDQLLHPDQLPALRQCLQRYSAESILPFYEAVLQARHNIARNANKTLQLEGLWLRLKQQQEA